MTKGLSPWMEPLPPSRVKPTPAAPLSSWTEMGAPTATQVTPADTSEEDTATSGLCLLQYEGPPPAESGGRATALYLIIYMFY